MSTNPYTDILETMGAVGAEKAREGALKFLLATVIAVDPITLDVCGTPQEAERVAVCSHLMRGYEESVNVKGRLAISASCPMGSHSSMTVNGGTLNLTLAKNILKAGDQVVVLTSDNQSFIIYDKVVYQ